MKTSLLISLIGLCAVCARAAVGEPPNIILLYADDAGYHDFGFQGNDQFQTPHLDRLAASGVVFNLADDPAEQHDLAQTHPERLREMFSKLHAWELELERPLFQLRRQEGALWQRLYDGYRDPSPASPVD